MKAILIREFGGPEVLRLEEVPMPTPGPGEVVIQVHAVSVNRTLDLVVRAGKYALPIALPHVLGTDPSGIVTAVGEGVTNRKPGDRVACTFLIRAPTPTEGMIVLGVQVWGGYAEYVKVPAHITYLVPDALDFPSATVVVRHGPTALSMLRDVAKLQADEWILVMGATGGLASAGIQVAKQLGAKVIAAAGSKERAEAAARLGADTAVDYRAEDLVARVREITGGRGVDVVFENIADPELFPKAVASLARAGRLITAGSHGGGTVPLDVTRLYLYNLTIVGSFGRVTPADVEATLAAAAQGRYRVLIDRMLPLSEAPLAHRIVAERSGIGKVILQPVAGAR
jgi:NADPH:quinone reductase-like Zn-dependent oxidoreductase